MSAIHDDSRGYSEVQNVSGLATTFTLSVTRVWFTSPNWYNASDQHLVATTLSGFMRMIWFVIMN